MRSHLEFRSGALCDPPGTVPAGRMLARQLEIALPAHGYRVRRILVEDWGWRLILANPGFTLWVGCGPHLDHPEDGHICFIVPYKPRAWGWLGRVDTTGVVERLAVALESSVLKSGVAHHLRWWSEEEVRTGHW